jgi:hypothetical protein
VHSLAELADNDEQGSLTSMLVHINSDPWTTNGNNKCANHWDDEKHAQKTTDKIINNEDSAIWHHDSASAKKSLKSPTN